MPQERNQQHRTFTDLRIPYKSFDSPTSTDPMWQDGSNVYCTERGYLERRPGFGSTIEPTPTVFKNIQRMYLWKRWDGTANSGYYLMISDLDTVAKVYKFKVGSDTSAALIFTSSSTTAFDFVAANNHCFFGNAVEMKAYDGATVRNWGITAPAAAPTVTLSGPGITAATGFQHCYTYGNSATGHESSPSKISAQVVPSNQEMDIAVVASTDPQVDQIHVYRTTDGGAASPTQMQELPASPYSNVNATIVDTSADTALLTSYAPAARYNDPPTPCKGFITSQGRIWGFKNNTLYYSGFEEISKGVGEESWPSGIGGNSRPYPREINGLAEVPASSSSAGGAAIYTSKIIYAVEGDTLDTFRWYTLLRRRGVRNSTCIEGLGTSIGWLDTAGQVWVSDSGEVGKDIRPDIKNIDHSQAALVVHSSGEFHWVVLSDGANQKLWVLNADTGHWQVPWLIHATAMHSGETADGTIDLLIAQNGTTILKLTPNIFTDNGTPYSAFLKTNMFDITNPPSSAARTFSSAQHPEWTSVVDYLEIERNAYPLSDVQQMNDDDTHFASYTSIFANERNPDHRGNGVNIVAKQYTSQPTEMNTGSAAARRVSFRLDWPAAATKFQLFSLDVSSHPAVSK